MDLVDNGYLGKIHQDALRVLEEVGVKCTSHEVCRIFEDTGLAAVDETTGHLHILVPLVEQALTMAPKRDQYWIPENAFGVGTIDLLLTALSFQQKGGDNLSPPFG